MINWEFVEKHKSEGPFKCLTVEQGREFLKACADHGYIWPDTMELMDWTNWEEEPFPVLFWLDSRKLVTYGHEAKGEIVHDPSSFIQPALSGQERITQEIHRIKDSFESFRDMVHEEFCEGHLCRFGDCEFCVTTKVYGYTCLLCQGSLILQKIQDVVENYEWKPEVKEMTVEEISKALGFEVKIVKED